VHKLVIKQLIHFLMNDWDLGLKDFNTWNQALIPLKQTSVTSFRSKMLDHSPPGIDITNLVWVAKLQIILVSARQ